MFIRFDVIHERDRRTDRRTPGDYTGEALRRRRPLALRRFAPPLSVPRSGPSPSAPRLGNANPVLIFQTRVYGFDRIQTRVPGYPGLTYDGSLVSGRLANRSL